MKKISFNEGWQYRNQNTDWAEVTLPHDAQISDVRTKDAPGGSAHAYFAGNVYYYQKKFQAPADWAGLHIEVLFEGIYKNSTVKLNGEALAEHKYGYTPFTVVLDGKLKYGLENVIEVEADNSKLPNSRWYSGGGIYRPVSLLVGPAEYIPWQGVKVRTVKINPAVISVKTAAVKTVSSETAAEDSAMENAVPVVTIREKESGKVVASGKGNDLTFEIPDVKLWSAETPFLYTCRAELGEGENADLSETTFGIRSLTANPQGLFVNGKQTYLKGGCVHHDNGIVGAASFPESEWRRVRILKEQGFNAIRVSHNPGPSAMMDACDYYGMYLMDETFDMWYVKKNKYDYGCDFKECWESDVTAMVEKDYNHPSVIMYSIGNEVSEPGKPDGVEQGKKIIALIKSLDDSRIVTGGMNLMIMSNYAKGKGQYDNVEAEQSKKEAEAAGKQPAGGNGKEEKKEKKESGNGSLLFNTIASFIGPGMNKAGNSDKVDQVTTPILDALDIAGYNYANGRYPMEGEKHPDRVIVGSETFPYEIGKNWDMVEKYPYLVGDFMWTSWDYLGETGIGAWSYTGGMPFNRPYPWLLGGAGVIDILGNPDGAIGMAQVVWKHTTGPVIGVRPVNHPGVRVSKSVWRGTNARFSWSWAGCDGNKTIIDVFAKANSVELLINGKSLDRQKIKDYQAMFKAKYQPGTIEAVAYDAAGREIGRNSLTSASGPVTVKVLPEKKTSAPGEVLYFDINISDANGIVESNSDRRLTVTSVEGGELLGFGSANPCTEERFTDGVYTTYYGQAQAIVRADKDADQVVLTVSDDRASYVSEAVVIERR